MLSVIVPIYNMELYLEQCIESIINQTYRNLEIILVDDGSTDNSGAICDRYAAADKRIKVIHKENGGRVSARNEGVKAATAEYVAFVDADDWLESDAYEELMKIICDNDCDAILTGYVRDETVGAREITALKNDGIYEGDKLVDYIYKDMIYNEERVGAGIYPSLCSKLWRKSVIESNQDDVDKDIFYGEDMALTYPALLSCKKVAVKNIAKYHYRIRTESDTHSIPDTFIESIGKLYKYMIRKLSDCDYAEMTVPQIKGYTEFLIRKADKKLLNGNISGKLFLFPYEKIEKGSRIVVYGAGEAGTSYMKQLNKNNFCEVVLWVDARYEALKKEGYDVRKPDDIKEMDYDYVLIAIENEITASKIKQNLILMGINEDKIFWCKPAVM